jgi:hypothetical protein
MTIIYTDTEENLNHPNPFVRQAAEAARRKRLAAEAGQTPIEQQPIDTTGFQTREEMAANPYSWVRNAGIYDNRLRADPRFTPFNMQSAVEFMRGYDQSKPLTDRETHLMMGLSAAKNRAIDQQYGGWNNFQNMGGGTLYIDGYEFDGRNFRPFGSNEWESYVPYGQDRPQVTPQPVTPPTVDQALPVTDAPPVGSATATPPPPTPVVSSLPVNPLASSNPSQIATINSISTGQTSPADYYPASGQIGSSGSAGSGKGGGQVYGGQLPQFFNQYPTQPQPAITPQPQPEVAQSMWTPPQPPAAQPSAQNNSGGYTPQQPSFSYGAGKGGRPNYGSGGGYGYGSGGKGGGYG